MEQSTAQTVVKATAILHYIAAGLLAILGIFFLTGSTALGAEDGFGRLAGFLALFFGISVLLLAILAGAIGYGLWSFMNWARVLLVAVNAVIVVTTLLTSMFGEVPPFNEILRSLAIILISSLLLYLFQNPAGPCRALFTGQALVAVKKN